MLIIEGSEEEKGGQESRGHASKMVRILSRGGAGCLAEDH